MDNIVEIIEFARSVAAQSADDYANAQLSGLISVVAVREYEILFKRILLSHAAKCHIHFGNFMEKSLGQLNGRVTVSDLADQVSRVARECRETFVKQHTLLTQQSLEREGFDVVNGYNSVVANRHSYVHKGNLTLTLNEVIRYAPEGLRIFECVTAALIEGAG